MPLSFLTAGEEKAKGKEEYWVGHELNEIFSMRSSEMISVRFSCGK
jgi:hypothetical protein